jgi:hypothetical protein
VHDRWDSGDDNAAEYIHPDDADDCWVAEEGEEEEPTVDEIVRFPDTSSSVPKKAQASQAWGQDELNDAFDRHIAALNGVKRQRSTKKRK